ncbi:hypothetical protein ETD86_30135 [Nonomuraea turkmeniaca]|uniref:Uncharacterized protein n=1 Tax=Nonomuraea turkmeniaca TaxID=103838 RepID=A0A5S4F9Y0_9ACTN|nr:hypothetical protein [Nonomuraea turkmeniaca]TMR13825.1 hypothetical protein ETD86_30135 [Nonomuraea turkmeniaca]
MVFERLPFHGHLAKELKSLGFDDGVRDIHARGDLTSLHVVTYRKQHIEIAVNEDDGIATMRLYDESDAAHAYDSVRVAIFDVLLPPKAIAAVVSVVADHEETFAERYEWLVARRRAALA